MAKAKTQPYKAIAEYYDPEYAHVGGLQRDVPFLLSKLPKKPQRLLELACGTGRAAIPLAQSGHRVTGVDYDADMLAIAKRKRDFVGLRDSELSLVKADIKRMKLGQTFDVAVILFNSLLSFATLGDLDAVLASTAKHLKKGGVFYLDLFNPSLELLAEHKTTNLDPVTFYVPTLDRTVSRTTDVEDVARQIRKVTMRYRWFDSGDERHETSTFHITWIMPREMQLLLERHGFAVEHQWGNYDGSEVKVASPRMITWGRKR